MSKVPESFDLHLRLSTRIQFRGIRRKNFSAIPSSLPETAVSIAVAATVVGAAATLLVKRTKASGELEVCYLHSSGILFLVVRGLSLRKVTRLQHNKWLREGKHS